MTTPISSNTSLQGAHQSQTKTTSTFALELKMIEAILAMLATRASGSASQLQNQLQIMKLGRLQLQKEQQKQLKEIAQAQAEQERSDHDSFWGKLGSDLLGLVGIIGTFIGAGPVAAAIAATTMALNMIPDGNSSVMGKLFGSIPGTSLEKAFAKFGICIALAAAEGGLAAGGDALLVKGVDTAAKTGETVTKETLIAVAKNSFKLNAQQVFLQTFLVSNCLGDLIDGIVQPGQNEKDQWIASGITCALTILLSVAAAKGFSTNGTATSSEVLVQKLPEAVKKSRVFAALQSIIKALHYSHLNDVLCVGFASLTAWMGGEQSYTYFQLASNMESQGKTQSTLTLLGNLYQMTKQQMQATTEQTNNDIQQLQNQCHFSDLTKESLYVAEIYA